MNDLITKENNKAHINTDTLFGMVSNIIGDSLGRELSKGAFMEAMEALTKAGLGKVEGNSLEINTTDVVRQSNELKSKIMQSIQKEMLKGS